MDLGLKGKVALVSCSSKGLGKATALSLASEGVNICIFARNEEHLHTTANEIKNKYNVSVLPIGADLNNEDDIKSTVEQTLKQFGKIDILINNSGGPILGMFEEIQQTDFVNAVNLVLLSVVNLTRRVLSSMKKQKWGRIINITSISGKQPLDNMILSNMVRPAVIGFAKTLASEVSKYNILVNTVCPGLFNTDRIKQLYSPKANEEGISLEEYLKKRTEHVPLKRPGDPKELGDFITFLSSERASYITGSVIQIDGGWYKGLL